MMRSLRAVIHDNVSRNVQSGMYIAARGFEIYENEFENAHGVTIRTSRGSVRANAPIVVSRTSSDIDYHGEDVDPATSHLFDSQTWIGHAPNWLF